MEFIQIVTYIIICTFYIVHVDPKSFINITRIISEKNYWKLEIR